VTAPVAWEPRGRLTSVSAMDHTRPDDRFTADLELLLRETDREDPILPEVRDADLEPQEEIDSRILAGLVNP
jgi:hypothetical protein